MLILDVRPAYTADDWPRAEPEKNGDSADVAEVRKPRLQSQQLRLKEGGVVLLSMRD